MGASVAWIIDMLKRIAIAVFACATIIVLFLHNPMSGWRYEPISSVYMVTSRPCTEGEREELRQTYRTANRAIPSGNGWSEAQIEKDAAACAVPVRSFLPFDQWSSNDPHLSWFGSVLHVLSLLVAVALLCCTIVYLFGGKLPKAK